MPKSDEQAGSSRPTRASAAPPLPRELGGSGGWAIPKAILPSRALHFRFRVPVSVRNRVRAAMLDADDWFLAEDREAPRTERSTLAIRWICRVFRVFAEEACRLGNADEEWAPSEIEAKSEEVLGLLAVEAEATKGASSLCDGHGQLRTVTRTEIAKSPEWMEYRSALRRVLAGSQQEICEREPRPRKPRGPHPDYNNALLVEEIIKTKAPNGDWQRNVEGVCQALDEAKVPPPEAWQGENYSGQPVGWLEKFEDDGSRSRHLVVEVIRYRLNAAKRYRELAGT